MAGKTPATGHKSKADRRGGFRPKERASEHANKTQIDDKIITNLCKYLRGRGGLK